MKIIEELIDRMDEELEGLEEYAEDALRMKAEYPSLANTLFVIAGEEKKHYQMLHAEVVKLIEEHKAKHGDPPAGMLAVYEYAHKKLVKRMAGIDAMLNAFAGK